MMQGAASLFGLAEPQKPQSNHMPISDVYRLECPYHFDVWYMYGVQLKYIVSSLLSPGQGDQGDQGDVSSHYIPSSNKATTPLPHKLNGHAKHVFRCVEVRVRALVAG